MVIPLENRRRILFGIATRITIRCSRRNSLCRIVCTCLSQGKIVVKLLFVIPREILTKFPVQQFWSPSVFEAGLSDSHILLMQCDATQNIEKGKKRKLNIEGIYTVQDFCKPSERIRRRFPL